MYTVNELEKISGVTRRTIGDYIAKGLLSGPSHRGRGARYAQSDADALQIIPRLRTFMKAEFPSLREVHDFLRQRSGYELRSLAGKSSEAAFELEVRTIRLQSSLAAILPQVPPERISQAIKQLTPEQITAVDTGRYQLGAVVDMASLMGQGNEGAARSASPLAGNGKSSSAEPHDGNGQDYLAPQQSWNVNWPEAGTYIDGHEFESEVTNSSALESISQRLERMASFTGTDLVRHELPEDSGLYEQVTAKVAPVADRLADIAERVERLERLLTTK